jgi:hypothetical protein
LSYSSVTLPAWLSFNTNTAVLSGTPSSGDIGFHPVTLRVSDLSGNTNQNFTVRVGIAGNDAPIITSRPNTGALENQTYSYTISAVDADGDPITYSAPIKPSWLSFNAGTRLLSGTPASTNIGLHLVNLTVYDGTITVTQQFNVVVFATSISSSNLVQNGSFELGGTSPTSWSVGSSTVGSTEQAQAGSASLKMMAGASNTRQYDIPLQTNTAYQLSVWVLASGLTSGGARFDTWDKYDGTANGLGGTCQFNIEVGDAQVWTQYTGTFNSSTGTSVTVRTYQSSMEGAVYFDNVVLALLNATNAAPVITSIPVTNAYQDVPYSYTLLAADAGNDALFFTGVSTPSWLSFNTTNGLLSGTPTGANAGFHPVSLRVSDGSLSVTQNFMVVVASPLTGYAAWASTNGVGAADTDYDSDGRNNFYEYALNGNPTNSIDNGVDPVLIRAGNGLEYIHLRRNDDASLIYSVEIRTNLLSGVWTTNGTSVLGTNAYNAAYDEVRYGVAVTNTRSYIRLKIENR